jgi:hypothetical protein
MRASDKSRKIQSSPDTLAGKIKAAHAEVEQASRRTLDRAIAAGEFRWKRKSC